MDSALPSPDLIRERYDALLARLRDAAGASGHDPEKLRIVAVTKEFPVAVARAAFEAGVTRLGESRIQEAEPKVAALPEAEWHFVGRLQSNKARRAVRGFAAIHSIDSLDLLGRVDELARNDDTRPDVLLQVNVTGDRTKAGFDPAELASARIDPPRSARLVGLMTIARLGASADEARGTFRALRELRDRLEGSTGIGLPELSMGMSDDADAAAAEGATLVRIGTALFGPRHATLVSSGG